MVVPALMIVALNVVFPYGVAFKLVAILGLVTLPFCCWAFGRLARFRYPMPELFALAATALPARRELLDLRRQREDHDGGRVLVLDRPVVRHPRPRPVRARAARPASTAAGRRSCSPWRCCRHGIVLIFVVLGAVLMWLCGWTRPGSSTASRCSPAAVLLSAFWVVPFLANHEYMTDMKYGGPARRRDATRSGTCSSRGRRSSTSSSRLRDHRLRRVRRAAPPRRRVARASAVWR